MELKIFVKYNHCMFLINNLLDWGLIPLSKDTAKLPATKIEAMDHYLANCTPIHSSNIINLVNQIFSINLLAMPLLPSCEMLNKDLHSLTPQSAIDEYLKHFSSIMSGEQVRNLINDVFGINLEALAALEKARISLYSKGQWMINHHEDLFVVHTGAGDVDVKIYPTAYFAEQTGLNGLPKDLIDKLLPLGYCKEEETESFYFSSPSGEAVPDAFKGQTIQAVLTVIRQAYSHI